MKASIRLYYVADPMCSWCWGFREALEGVLQGLRGEIELRLVLGGLAPDDARPMEASMRAFVQDAWRAVAAKTGAHFNHDFWTQCEPRRSTWPACRAVLAAQAHAPELALPMFTAIQRAYYLEARNPSDVETLVELASGLGIPKTDFIERIASPSTQSLLQADFALRDRLGTRGYPSLALEQAGHIDVLTRGYESRASLQAIMTERGLMA